MERKGARRTFLVLTVCGHGVTAFARSWEGITVWLVASLLESRIA